MDKLKLYAAPLIALVLILVWFLVVRPKLDEGEPAPGSEQKSEQKSDGEAPAKPQ